MADSGSVCQAEVNGSWLLGATQNVPYADIARDSGLPDLTMVPTGKPVCGLCLSDANPHSLSAKHTQ